MRSGKAVEVEWVERLALLDLSQRWQISEKEAMQKIIRDAVRRELIDGDTQVQQTEHKQREKQEREGA